jgi:hypothetical protein
MTKDEITVLERALHQPMMSTDAVAAIRILIRQALKREREEIK